MSRVPPADIDDKIIARSQERSIPFAQLARTFEAEFFDDMKALGVKTPHVVTRVSEYVPEVVDMIQQIIDNGFAYPSNGSVYFDVPAFKKTQDSGHSYGKLVPENVGDEAALAEGEGRLSERCVALRCARCQSKLMASCVFAVLVCPISAP